MDFTGGNGAIIRAQLELLVKVGNRQAEALEGINAGVLRLSKAIEYALNPQSAGSGLRTSPPVEGTPDEDLSWIGQTDEVKAAVEEWMSRQLGRPLDEEEALTLERKFDSGGLGASDSRVSGLPKPKPASEEEARAPEEISSGDLGVL